MAKQRGSWFFEGYETQIKTGKNGKKKRELVYRGEWYGLGMIKAEYTLYKGVLFWIMLLLTAAFLIINFLPTAGGMTPWVGAPCLLSLVPLMFMWIGLVNFLIAKQEWEIRVFYAGYRRLKRWTMVFFVPMGVTLVAELVYMIRIGPIGVEISYFSGVLVSLLCAGAVLLLQRRYPAVVVRRPEVR